MPHLSIGQYGALGTDIGLLDTITRDVSIKTPVIQLNMCPKLSLFGSYLFFDARECFEHVDEHICSAFKLLRTNYFDKIETRFPVAQAHLAKKRLINNPSEMQLLNLYFQNWMIPEYNRMRPHFTMLYHPPFEPDSMITLLEKNEDIKQLLNALSTVTLTHLGVLQIDTFGNPIENGLICSYPLSK
jgi:hypothetical protein